MASSGSGNIRGTMTDNSRRALLATSADPIFEVIEDHLGIIREVDVAYAKSPADPELSELYAMERYAAQRVVSTAPTTMAGVKALEVHLDMERILGSVLPGTSGFECLRLIRNRWLETQPGCRMSEEDVAYVAAAPWGSIETWRRYYERPLGAFLAERRAA
jgi:hypothetical protein